MKDFLEAYRREVTDLEQKDISLRGNTRSKIFDFENKLTREKGIISNDYVLLWLLKNVLLDANLTEKRIPNFDTKDRDIEKAIREEFSVPVK